MTTRTAITVAAALALVACDERISLVPTERASPLEHRGDRNPAPAPPATEATSPAPAEGQTSPPTATPAPAPAPALSPTAPTIPPASKLLRGAIALEPTGTELPLLRDDETVIDPAATFRLELAAATPDARLVLLDRNDAIVPSKGSREIGAVTRFTLAPAEPLVPGSRYVLRLDGVRTRELHDAAGTAYAPFTLTVLVAGTPPPPEPKPAKRKRGRR
jgi:hypothetical protein